MKLDCNANKERFINLLKSTLVPNIDTLINWLIKTDFFTAPSSTIYHNNFEGGLCAHSLNVYDILFNIHESMMKLVPDKVKNIGMDSLILAALLHDICKVNQYKSKQKWRKDANDKWESYNGWEIIDEFPLGHGEKSVFMCERMGIHLSKEVILAIRWHMGTWEIANNMSTPTKYSFASANENYPLCTMLQSADVMASMIMEETQI